MKQRYTITVNGAHKRWCFDFEADPQYVEEWRSDGLEIDELGNSIPLWVVRLGLLRPWVAAQDAWNWLRLW
jgi:hypothetical protein